MKIYIWGTGKVAKKYLCKKEISQDDLLGFIESKPASSEFMGRQILSPKEIRDKDFDFILVCMYYETRTILQTCIEEMIPLEKVFFMDNYEWADKTSMRYLPANLYKKIHDKQNENMIKERFPLFFTMMDEKEQDISRYAIIKRTGLDLIEKNGLLQSAEFSSKEYQSDYCRYRTFELIADEIERKGVEGEVAELGVFRGTFAKLINARFKDRRLYLFDTFDSFDREEYERELKNEHCKEDFYEVFKNTSADKVIQRMLYPDQCILKVGFFPGTVTGLNDLSFAFVSIDVDFEQSILEGLRFFYPRMSKGGIIFVHDYNNRFLQGVRKAINLYEEEMSICLTKIPISDEGGTLIILK